MFRPDSEPLLPELALAAGRLPRPRGHGRRQRHAGPSAAGAGQAAGCRRPARTGRPAGSTSSSSSASSSASPSRARRAGPDGARSRDHVFGVVLVNDWSARDIQAWEYVPLGPFLGKSFATSISAWVTPLALLEERRVGGPPQDPAPLPHLRGRRRLGPRPPPRGGAERRRVVARATRASLYWTMPQQLAHATSNGASVRTRRPDGLGDDLRRRARQRRVADRADLERRRAAPPRRRLGADVPRGRRRGRPARRAAAARCAAASSRARELALGLVRRAPAPRRAAHPVPEKRPGLAAAARRLPRALGRERRGDRPRLRAPAGDEAVAAAPAPLRRGRSGEAARSGVRVCPARSGLAGAGTRSLGRSRGAGRAEAPRRGPARARGGVPRLAGAGRGTRAPGAVGPAGLARGRSPVARARGCPPRPFDPRHRAVEAVEHLVGAANRDGRAATSTSRCRRGCRSSSKRRP